MKIKLYILSLTYIRKYLLYTIYTIYTMNLQTLTELSQVRSQSGGTSLVTLYISSKSALWLASDKLISELSTASNIKSKSVRKDVIQALKSGLQQIKTYKSSTSPENGLVLCAGNFMKTGQLV